MRISDPRLGRFLSVDPLSDIYPWYTPYQFAGNTPIQAIDLDGLEEWKVNDGPATGTVHGPYQNQKEAQQATNRSDNAIDLEPVTFKSYNKQKDGSANDNKGKLSDGEVKKIGEKLGVESAVIIAVITVESGKGGFEGGLPKIRFEGHQFKHYLQQDNLDIDNLQSKYPNLIYGYSKLNSKIMPHGYSAYNLAFSIDKDAAMKSTSYGAFQIMGFNHQLAGFKSISGFVNAQNTYAGQAQSFVSLISKTPSLLSALRDKNFTNFAKQYNGTRYKDNNYDEKMQKIYEKYK